MKPDVASGEYPSSDPEERQVSRLTRAVAIAGVLIVIAGAGVGAFYGTRALLPQHAPLAALRLASRSGGTLTVTPLSGGSVLLESSRFT